MKDICNPFYKQDDQFYYFNVGGEQKSKQTEYCSPGCVATYESFSNYKKCRERSEAESPLRRYSTLFASLPILAQIKKEIREIICSEEK